MNSGRPKSTTITVQSVANIGALNEACVGELKDSYFHGEPQYCWKAILEKYGYRIQPTLVKKWLERQFPDPLDLQNDPTEELGELSKEDQALRLMWRKLLIAIRALDGTKVSAAQSLESLAGILVKLANAQSTLRRLDIEEGKTEKRQRELHEKAKEEVLLELRKALPQKPELVQALADVMAFSSEDLSKDLMGRMN